MASTPPLQIAGSPRTPSTPYHGAMYEDSPRRTSARLRQKRALEEEPSQASARATRFAKTPTSPRTSMIGPHSPDQTPQRKSTTRRVQIMSPASPESDTSAFKPTSSRATTHQPFLSSSTVLNEGMLPTPVKTPNKKHKNINKSNIAARALFQDQLGSEETMQSPRRNRKNKRYNGFSLESFRAEEGHSRNGIQIFTDSRDQVPEIDKDEDNPFVDDEQQGSSSKKVAGTAKRRKVSQSKKLDPQVEEALQNDEGMVYVFRGKKVYRRFEDDGDEEEIIDTGDLGLLRGTSDGDQIVRPLKTLTRKSIRPTRLFQTEEQKRARELEKEEEAATDIEEETPDPSASQTVISKRAAQVDDEHKANKGKAKTTKRDSIGVNSRVAGKPGSPFDAWPRVKPGSASSSSNTKPTRGRKRAASESFEERPAVKA